MSSLQGHFRAAMEQLHRAQEQMKKNADQHHRAVDYVAGDAILLNTRYLRFKNRPRKLQRSIRGPLLDQEENQFNNLRIGPACILVSTSSLSQFSLEALAGVRVEVPGRYTCSGFRSLTGTNILRWSEY